MKAEGLEEAVVGVNRDWWDERAHLHGQDVYYDTQSFLDGASTLLEVDHQLFGHVHGLQLVHLQCHTGLDTLSWLRAGAATVTGVDFSSVAVTKAQATAEEAELAERARFVCADVLTAPKVLKGRRFDVCYASRGVLGWIDDVDSWMRAGSALLRPGGRLGIHDIHPLYTMPVSLDPLILDFPYSYDGPRTFTSSGSYAVPDAATICNEHTEYAHSLGEIVTAAASAGLQVQKLVEHLASPIDDRRLLTTADDDHNFRWRITGELLPLYYSLVAVKT